MTSTEVAAQAAGSGSWGLLGPLTVFGERRARTLGLASAVRLFNDRAVPGLGGLWFAKPLVLSTLGVAIATQARRRNIEVANAIEALACWLGLKGGGWRADPRLRGRVKLNGVESPIYAKARRPNFYVSQPMRQQAVQPLLALGLVEARGERFNSFTVSDSGRALLDSGLTDFRPHRQSVEAFLYQWVDGSDRSLDTSELRRALSPLEALPGPCRDLIRDRLAVPNTTSGARRLAALRWVQSLSHATPIAWEARPPHLDEDHWLDLRCGGRFFVMRDAALAVLDAAESALASSQSPTLSLRAPLPEPIRPAIAALKQRADGFLQMDHDPSPASIASAFARQCRGRNEADILAELVRRDGRGLRLGDAGVLRGPAFRAHSRPVTDSDDDFNEPTETEDAGEAVGATGFNWPPGISVRVKNLFTLHQDLEGRLDTWLAPAEAN